MKKRGLTLLETLFWVGIVFMGTLAVAALFKIAGSAQKTTLSGYLVSGQTDSALRWLRRDFQETALVSIRVFPNAGAANQPPGCSFVSARDDKQNLQVSRYGTPLWSKHVLYTLEPKAGKKTGSLVRWELPIVEAQRDFVPRPCAMMPSPVTNNSARRVLLQDVLLANTAVPNLQQEANYVSDKYGGFKVQFVQRTGGEGGNEGLSEVNPTDTTLPQTDANHTRLVNVRLELLPRDSHHPDFFRLEFKARPRY